MRHTVPPPRFCVFSATSILLMGWCTFGVRTAPATSAASKSPPSPRTVRTIAPESAAGAPVS